MKNLFFLLLTLGLQLGYSQVKIMTFEDAEHQKLSTKHLDSLYPTPEKFFDGTREAYFKDQRSFVMRINTLSRQLTTKKDNARIWGRFYVGKEGRFDYFLYQIEGKISLETETRLIDSLQSFLSAYRFPVKITAAHSFHQIIQLGAVRRVVKGKNTINSLEDALTTIRPDTVKVLALNQLDLERVPDVIYRFTEMKELNLSDNLLSSANIDLTRLPKLRHIWLNGNKLADDSLQLPENKTLKILNIQNNRFADIPQAVRNCKKLTSLWLGYNKLTQINQNSFKGLRKLQDLNLYSCDIENLPKEIAKLRRLEVLDLYYNQLAELPNSLGRMRRLQQLALANNQLKTLPASLGRMKRLQTLYVHHNKLETLPTHIKRLRRLRIFDINNNHFSTLPYQIGKLRRVEDLDISHNNLSEVPKELLKLQQLKKLYLRSNPFSRDAMLLSRSKPVIESLENNKTDVSY